MTQYLLTAEADQIQDFIFRASHLQEVVGGSQLLTRFCQKVPGLLGCRQNQLIIHAGGKFSVVFDEKDEAIEFGNRLAEVYRCMADGTLTVAEPVPINGNFSTASEQAEEKLRQAKRARRPSTGTTPHLPYMALCQSCGVGLAVTHGKLYSDDANEKYLCRACKSKQAERQTNRRDEFLVPFVEEVFPSEVNVEKKLPIALCPEDVSGCDPRRHVAYLVADGNNMGKVFAQCDQTQMTMLSQRMPEILRQCLAEPTKTLRHTQQRESDCDSIPVLPLILGGDDIFALLPAPWALSFTLEFCRRYQEQVGTLLRDEMKIPGQEATISAAVVICKEKYPHTLAHQIGKQCLSQAKYLAKACAFTSSMAVSAVDFEVITGSQADVKSVTGEGRATLRPYLVLPENVKAVPAGWGLSLGRLLEQRLKLCTLPRRRLAQLRQHFDNIPAQGSRKEWRETLEKLVTRISRSQEAATVTKNALNILGSDAEDWLYFVNRQGEAKGWYGHGLPDLLNVWDFAFAIDEPQSTYEELV